MSLSDPTEFNSESSSTTNDAEEIHTHELQQLVHVARSYLDNGDLEGAEDVLQEVIEAGTHSEEVDVLIDRLHRLKAGSTENEDVVIESEMPSTGLRPFTRPLPGADRLERDVQRQLQEAEEDYLAGHLNSALDLTMSSIASVPDFLPLFTRLCEIRIALGEADQASLTLSMIHRFHQLNDTQLDPYERGVKVALDPDNTQALLEHARFLLSQRGAVALDPFVPAAIEATIGDYPEEANELANQYVELRPNDDEAVRVYLRAAVTASDPDVIVPALKTHVTSSCKSPDLLYLRTVASWIDADADWSSWLERAIHFIRENSDLSPSVLEVIQSSAHIAPDDKRHLATALITMAAGDPRGAQVSLDEWEKMAAFQTSDNFDTCLASCARVLVKDELDESNPVDALRDAIDTMVGRNVGFESQISSLLNRQIDLNWLLCRYIDASVTSDQERSAIEHLRALRASHPDLELLHSSLADALIAGGRVNDGIRELRTIALRKEQKGEYDAMVAAMRRISAAVPKNMEIKSMLIDVYSRRGILDEALDELSALAQLQRDQGHINEAVASYTKAAEIACALGDFQRGNVLYGEGVASDPDNVPVRHAAVAFYLQTGAVDQAAQQLRQVVRIALEEEDPDEAVAALHQIIGLAPQDSEAYHRLGEVLTSMGEYAQAERVYRRLAEFAPDDPVLAAKQSALAVLASTR